MELINVKINGIETQVEKGTTILEAAHAVGVEIPTLCYLKDINAIGACRICMVECTGARGLVPACVYPLEKDGTEVHTNTPAVQQARRTNLQLVLSTHDQDCLSCVRSGNCELQKLCHDYGVSDTGRFGHVREQYAIDDSAPHMVRDNNKCILCRRCVAACAKNQGVGVIGPNERGFATHIGCAFEAPLAQSACVSCGQCIVVCPTGALHEKDDTEKVWAALADPTKHVVVQTAPSVRATLGECFGMPVGTNVEGKMVAALRRLGFAKVFDTDWAADLTIMEEANEFVQRVKNGGKLPMITSCSPGWVKYCETFHPEFIDNLSTCKSPQQMFGAMTKTYYAQKAGIDPKDIVCVAIMPCTAKKFEIGRPDQSAAGEGIPDVDIALTTRELGRMIQRAGLQFDRLPDEPFDSIMGTASGAGHIFGATGGVMEAALRTAVATLTGSRPESVDFHEVRGTADLKEATYQAGGVTVRVAVTSGLANAGRLLDAVNAGEKQYDFIEVMACPGGCVNGGGQPTQPASVRNFTDLRALRAAALYAEDASMQLRCSHDNPEIQAAYAEFLGTPGGEKAHHILHTSYTPRAKNF